MSGETVNRQWVAEDITIAESASDSSVIDMRHYGMLAVLMPGAFEANTKYLHWKGCDSEDGTFRVIDSDEWDTKYTDVEGHTNTWKTAPPDLAPYPFLKCYFAESDGTPITQGTARTLTLVKKM